MNPELASAPIVGTVISPEATGAVDTALIIGEVFGMDVQRSIALLVLAALLFFFGVMLSCLLRLNGNTHWFKVCLSSIVVFFLCSPAWAYTLEGNWSTKSDMPLLDKLFQWAKGMDTMPSNLFALGIVILMGMLAWPLLHFILRMARSQFPPAPPRP